MVPVRYKLRFGEQPLLSLLQDAYSPLLRVDHSRVYLKLRRFIFSFVETPNSILCI